MRIFALFTSLVVSSQCFADTNADRPNLDDPEVLKKIIEEAVELVALKKADGNLQYFVALEFLPFQGSGWGVTYYENKNQDSNKKLEALIQFLKGEPEGQAGFEEVHGRGCCGDCRCECQHAGCPLELHDVSEQPREDVESARHPLGRSERAPKRRRVRED